MRRPDPGAGLELEAVTAGYGRQPVLEDVSLRAEAGRVTGLIGPNGSGKTTIVRVASRSLRPSAGSIRLQGRDPYAMPARQAARLVAVVPQELSPVFPFSVLDVVLMGRSPYFSGWRGGGPEDWQRVRRAMAVANVQHLAERSFDRLSGGERQRVVVAQALAQDAPVLLLDEPTTHLDVRHVVETLALLRALARVEGRAVLAIFHDLNLASIHCDRIVALERGRVVADGRPEDVVTPGLLRDVFGVEAEVVATAGRPAVVVAAPVPARPASGAIRAHVVGGAGRGAEIMRSLAERGFDVTTGVLHGTDTDAAVAERLNLLRVTVPPFSTIDARSAADCAALIRSASILVVCDAPFGPGNVLNLRLAVEAMEAGVPTFLLEQVPIEERDFTGGEATRLWVRLRAGAHVAASAGGLVEEVAAR